MRRNLPNYVLCFTGGFDIGLGAVNLARYVDGNNWKMLLSLVAILLGVLFFYSGISGLREDKANGNR